ncbi:MAG: hypothetical protein ACLTLI_02935 [Clostridia bacterium]
MSVLLYDLILRLYVEVFRLAATAAVNTAISSSSSVSSAVSSSTGAA